MYVATLQPLKIVVTKIGILHLVFFCTCGLSFAHFKYIALTLDLKLANLKRNSNKHLQTWTY
jgi:hypothetical protein